MASQTVTPMMKLLSELLTSWQEPCGPKLIVGDFNASIRRLPTLQEEIAQGNQWDIRAIASAFGAANDQPTCKAPNSSQWTRRDYVIANNQAKDLVHTFKNGYDSNLQTHAVINLELKRRLPNSTIRCC